MNSMLGKDGTLFAQIDGEYDGNGGGVAMCITAQAIISSGVLRMQEKILF